MKGFAAVVAVVIVVGNLGAAVWACNVAGVGFGTGTMIEAEKMFFALLQVIKNFGLF